MITKTLLLTLFQKKMRASLLLFSIAVCASLLFANLGFQKTISQMIFNAGTRFAGDADLYITTSQSAGTKEWISPDLLTPYRNELAYDISFIRNQALYSPIVDEVHYFTMLGVNIQEFNLYNPLILQAGSMDNWTGNKLIVGSAYAEQLGFKVGDTITFEINGQSHALEIAGISQPSSIFTRELDDGGYLLIPKETLSAIVGGQCNLIFLKANDPAFIPALKQTLTDTFPEYTIHTGINQNVINTETNNYTMPFWISSITVMLMSIFIIYSSFNLIVSERISILGIMRSVGCTRRKINRILIFESIIIGVLGGAAGCILGIGVLHLIRSVYFSGESAVINAPVLFSIKEVIFTIAASTMVAAFGAMLPILKITKVPIKNIILGSSGKRQFKTAKLWPLGIFLLLCCWLFPVLVHNKGLPSILFASIFASLALIGLNLLIPSLCHLAAFILQGAPHDVWLGLRNVGDFKALINNTRLFATVIAIMVFMMTIFSSLTNDLQNMYEREHYDITVQLRESTPAALNRLSSTDGVISYYGVYTASADINSHNSFMNAVIGIDDLTYFSYSPAKISDDTQAAIDTLDNGQNIITTNILRKKLGLNIGDILTLQFDNSTYDFKITGFLDTNYSIGHVGFISSENLKTATGIQDYSQILVRTSGNPKTVKNNILRMLAKDVLLIKTKLERKAANAGKIEGIFNAINTYAYFAMFIGVFGIINNMAACFLDRRRNLALYRCIGMCTRSARRMLVTESIAIGVVGTFIGLGTGLIMTGTIPAIVDMIWGSVIIVVPAIKIVCMCAAGITAMLICAVLPFIKIKNITIMDSIRYE